MRHFVFVNQKGEYMLVYSTSMKKAERDMQNVCIAAFMHETDAQKYVDENNKLYKNKF